MNQRANALCGGKKASYAKFVSFSNTATVSAPDNTKQRFQWNGAVVPKQWNSVMKSSWIFWPERVSCRKPSCHDFVFNLMQKWQNQTLNQIMSQEIGKSCLLSNAPLPMNSISSNHSTLGSPAKFQFRFYLSCIGHCIWDNKTVIHQSLWWYCRDAIFLSGFGASPVHWKLWQHPWGRHLQLFW